MIFTAVFLGWFLSILPLFAQELQINYPPLPGAAIPNSRISSADFARYIYQASLIGGIFIAVLMFLRAGFLYLTVLDNPDRQKEAKAYLIAALTGITLLFGSFVILRTIDPDLVLLSPSPPQSLPEQQKIEGPQIPEIKPQSYTALTTFEEDTKALANFLTSKIDQMLVIEFLDTKGFLDAIAKAKDVNCQDSHTWCEPKTESTDCIAVGCVWKEDPEGVLLKKVKDALIGLDKLRVLMKEVIESKEAKKVKGDLNELERCEQDFAASLLLEPQAKQKGFFDHFKITSSKPLDFYCLFP